MIAAIMTAANLGSRLTGWGFVIFTIGAAGWCIDAVLTGQQNLFWSNAFLGVVDMIGVYRWLGQRAKLEDGAQAAVEKSRTNPKPLFPILSLDGRAIDGDDDVPVAHVVRAMEAPQVALRGQPHERRRPRIRPSSHPLAVIDGRLRHCRRRPGRTDGSHLSRTVPPLRPSCRCRSASAAVAPPRTILILSRQRFASSKSSASSAASILV